MDWIKIAEIVTAIIIAEIIVTVTGHVARIFRSPYHGEQ